MGEDHSFTTGENELLAKEAEKYRDILIAPYEDTAGNESGKTKHCIYWVTRNHDFDILIKTNDDSTLFLSRLVGNGGWLRKICGLRELLYFGKKHAIEKVANPANLKPGEIAGTEMMFEFDYRGAYWPEFMDGGMYGLSRRLAEEIVRNDFRTYTLEDAMVGVWVSAFRTETRYLSDEQALSRETDYKSSNGTAVVATFHTDLLRQASMWCEYMKLSSVSRPAITAENVKEALECLSALEGSTHACQSQPLGDSENHHAATLAALTHEWPIKERPDLRDTGQWWGRMGGVFRGNPVALVGTSAARDRLPLYMFQEMHTLVLDDFFRVSERYGSWAPTMYMCVDPVLCASSSGTRAGRQGLEASPNVESVNRFARTVSAAFYVLSGGVDGSEYWRYLRQRVNVHWFMAGEEETLAGMGPVAGAEAEVGSAHNFRVASLASGVAMGVEVLSYLGFSPILITAADEELNKQWDEVKRATQLAGLRYGTEVVYLYADERDKLPKDKVGGKGRGSGTISAQENIVAWGKKRSQESGKRQDRWDLELFAQQFPVNRLESFINRRSTSLRGMFPKSPSCRDVDDLDRFQKIVLCPVKTSLRHFQSFLTWHIPYGPVQDTFVWVKRS